MLPPKAYCYFHLSTNSFTGIENIWIAGVFCQIGNHHQLIILGIEAEQFKIGCA